MAKRRYSDEDRANALAALAANGGNVSKTARDLDIPEPTLRCWATGERHPEALQMRDGKMADLADRLEEVAWKLSDAIPGKIGKASLKDTAISLGITVEKMRLLRDKPTSISKDATEPDLSALDDEELRQYERLHRKLAGLPEEREGGEEGEVPPQS